MCASHNTNSIAPQAAGTLLVVLLSCAALVRCRYETWRRQRLTRPKIGSRLRNFAITTLVPVALAFYYAKRGLDMHSVRQ